MAKNPRRKPEKKPKKPMATGAIQSRARVRDRLSAWRQHHGRSAKDSLARLLSRPLASLMTWLVIGVALALPVGLSVALENARAVTGNWDSPARISLFLRPDIPAVAAAALQERLQEDPAIARTRLVSRGDALAEFREMSGLGDVLRHLEDNPLPNLILVVPAAPDHDAAAALKLQLQGEDAVETAVLDMAWVQRLNALVHLSRRIVLVLGSLLALGVLLVVGNTIRLAIENRREEIVIAKLVGGSNAFVRRPFLYTGLWYGIGGAAAAWVMINLALLALRGPLSALAMLYQSNFPLQGIGAADGLQLTGIGALLGLLGAWFAVARHLGEVEPR